MIRSDLSEPLIFSHNMSINVSYGHFYSSFPTHWHNFLEIIAPLSDNYSVTIGTEKYFLTENQIALIPPRTLHSIEKRNHEPNLILQFSGTLLQQLHEFMINRQLFYKTLIIQADDSFFEENPIHILLKIKNHYFSDSSFKELSMYEALLHFFLLLGNHNLHIKNKLLAEKTPKQKAYDQKFDSISQYIETHCTGTVSLEEVAEFAGFSKYHFSRLFKEYYQMSFPEYVTSLRIAKATELLGDLSLSVMDVAMHSGFSNLSSFNRAFKQINGCTPTQFRKMADFFPAS